MLTRFQQSILKMISSDEPAEATADRICREAEGFAPGVLCSMVTIDHGRIHPLANPSLPEQYAAAVDGIPIGPEVGSCGSAAYLRKPVAVTDISADHRWAPYKSIAEPLGLRACWSSPIVGGDERVIGAFGFYYRDTRGPSAEEERVVAECTDLSAVLLHRREDRAENFRLTYLDTLTGLGNRAGLERAVIQGARRGTKLGLLSIDIERLRDVNDEHGYSIGDALIRGIAERILRGLRPGQAFRMQGGEFAVLLEDPSSPEILSEVAERILASMQLAVACNGYPVRATLTCGGAIFHPLLFSEPETLRWQAALALRQAKDNGDGRFVLFSEKLATVSRRRFQAVYTAKRALSEDRVEAHYQPLVELTTGAVVGVEALFRVRAPHGNVIAAGELAPAMQSPQTAPHITDRMLALVARDARRWLNLGIRLEHVAVNLSPADFQREDLCGRIVDAFSQRGVPLGQILLEVAETTCLNDADRRVIGAIERLRGAGLRVALDDFGAGVASLADLLEVPADFLKVDKSLVDRLSPGSTEEVVLKALVEMARGLGLTLLVEGVETREQASALVMLGCRLGQGFLFGRPMPAAAIEEMLREPAVQRSNWLA